MLHWGSNQSDNVRNSCWHNFCQSGLLLKQLLERVVTPVHDASSTIELGAKCSTCALVYSHSEVVAQQEWVLNGKKMLFGFLPVCPTFEMLTQAPSFANTNDLVCNIKPAKLCNEYYLSVPLVSQSNDISNELQQVYYWTIDSLLSKKPKSSAQFTFRSTPDLSLQLKSRSLYFFTPKQIILLRGAITSPKAGHMHNITKAKPLPLTLQYSAICQPQILETLLCQN